MGNQTGLATKPLKYTAESKPYYDRYISGYLTPTINSLNTQINGTFGALQTSYSSHHQGGKVDATYYYGTMFYKHANGTTVTVNSFSSGGVGISGTKKSFTSAERAAGEAKRQAAISTWNNTTKPALVQQRDALVAQRTGLTGVAMYVEEEVALAGKPITRASFLDAFNKHVADRINSRTKWSKNWYETAIGTADLNTKVWNAIVPHLDSSTFGTFGVMQASADPTVAQIQAAVSPNDAAGATKKAANYVAAKNAVYGLKTACEQLGRVKQLNITIYWEGSLNRTISQLAITNRGWVTDAFMYKYMPEGSLITEAGMMSVFNSMRQELEAQMLVNRDLRVDYCHSSCHSSGRSRR